MENYKKILLGLLLLTISVGGYFWFNRSVNQNAVLDIKDPFAGLKVPSGLDEPTKALYEEKFTLTKEMYEKQPDIWETWVAIGNIKSLFGDQEGALAAYQQSVSLQPNNIVAERNIAVMYADHFKDYERAAAHYRAAIRNEVNNVELYINLIMIEWKELDDLATAESTLQTGLTKTRYHYDLVRLAGQFYRETGSLAKAEEYEKALTKMPRPSEPTPAVLGIPGN